MAWQECVVHAVVLCSVGVVKAQLVRHGEAGLITVAAKLKGKKVAKTCIIIIHS